MASLAGDKRFSSKSDILTPAKEALRRRREVFVASGTPDSSVRSGNIRRRYNPARPHLNSVPSGLRMAPEQRPADDGDVHWLERTIGA